MLFAGTANPPLAQAIARRLGRPLGRCTWTTFPDGESSVLVEESVQGREVVLVQPTSPPVNEHLMEVLICADACRRADATGITALVPYLGYARQDKRGNRRAPITASVVAQMMQSVGITRLVTLDLHTDQIEGFFTIPVEHLTAVPLLCEAVRQFVPMDAVVVSPDVGRVTAATDYARRLGTSVVILHKQRESGAATTVTHVVGEVRGRACLIIDDMIATGATLERSIAALLEAGARPEIVIAATHGLFLEGARERLSHPSIRALVVTDAVPPPDDWPVVRTVSVAPVFADAILRMLHAPHSGDLGG
jgi:ribose-phosphate pyrophosphokinase